MADPRARRRRLAAGLLVVPVVVLGLGARFLGAGPAADLSGGVLYAVLVYVLLVFLRPRAAPWSNAAIALAFCVADRAAADHLDPGDACRGLPAGPAGARVHLCPA